MSIIQWSDAFNTGIEEVDIQHRYFVNLIGKIEWADKSRYPRNVANMLIAEIVKYAEFHFLSEENLMFLHRYPGLQRQHDEHRKLLSILGAKITEFLDDRSSLESIGRFLAMWFASHTTEEDKKFGRFLFEDKTKP